MKDQAKSVVRSLKQFWKSQSKKRRIVIIGGFLVIVALAVILSMALNKPKEYTTLYTGLDTAEAAEILTELQNMSVDAQIMADGTILVPAEQENSLKMQLATKGYPKTGFSYDIWTEKVNMFTTDTQMREIVKMQLESKVKATIEMFSVVVTAYVIIDIPESSNTVISTNTKKATASVVLHLKANMSLTSSQIIGIKHIIMTALSGLEEENITITDGNGNKLSADGEGQSGLDAVAVDIQRHKFKTDFETAIQDELLELLQPAYGADGVRVAVNAVFDYDKNVKEETTYTPSVDDHGMIDQEDVSESSGSIATEPGEVVGEEPNADGTYPTVDGEDGTTESWSNMSKSTSYLVNTLKEQTEKNGYYVDQVSISVIIYRNVLGDTEKTQVINVVCNAANTLPELVSVENLPLLEERPEDDIDEPVIVEPNPVPLYFGFTLQELIIIGVLALIVLLIILIVVSTIIKKKRKKKALKLAREQQAAEAAAAAASAALMGDDIKSLSENQPETKEAAVRREIGEFAKNSPDIAAQLLKSWLHDGGGE
ncbi:MAG: flagellar basal-body MS-ring/collar protein FliF [Oscillospiraceae bacterium]|jgi:flagellar M-ring protein FliF